MNFSRSTLLVASLALCVTACKQRINGSATTEIGGDPSSFSCDVARHELAKAMPDLADAEKRAKESGCEFVASDASAPQTRYGSSGVTDPYRLTGEEPNETEAADSTANSAAAPTAPYCKEALTYITARQAYVKALNDRIDHPRDPCPRNAEGFTAVWEFPTCGVGNECSDGFNERNGTACKTCSFGQEEKSAITCQSEEAARDAVQIWCLRNARSCSDRSQRDDITCKDAPSLDRDYARANQRISGQMTFNSKTDATRIYLNGQVKAEAGALGNSANALVKGRIAADVVIGHEVINSTDEQTWIKRGDRIEGGYKTKFRCTLWIANAVMLGAEGGMTWGFKFPGTSTGVETSVQGGGEYERKNGNWSMTRNLSGAGKTADQMQADCKQFLQTRMEQDVQTILTNFGLATPNGESGAAGSRGKSCFENKDCAGSDYQRWLGYCHKTGDALVGRCGYVQTAGGRCNVPEEPPCRPGTRCELVSYAEFLGWRFNKDFRCR